MDYEYLSIGILLIILGVLIIVFKAEIYKPNNEETGFKHNAIGGAIICLIIGCYLIFQEISKVI